jgi:hypothetical protein
MYNISTSSLVNNIWYANYLTISIAIRNCQFTLGKLTVSMDYWYSTPIYILNSVLNKVIFTESSYNNSNNYPQTQLIMHNVSFIDGTINLPFHQADISYSTITLRAPPLLIGGNSYISCSSIARSGSILQVDTIGLNATGLILTNSTIKNFAVSLQIVSTYLNTATITTTNVESNSKYNIDDKGVYNVTATGVYWGTTNAGVIASKINDYWDNINYGEVVYTNYALTHLPAETGCRPYVDQEFEETTWSTYWGK